MKNDEDIEVAIGHLNKVIQEAARESTLNSRGNPKISTIAQYIKIKVEGKTKQWQRLRLIVKIEKKKNKIE